jgi:hypothetical protein
MEMPVLVMAHLRARDASAVTTLSLSRAEELDELEEADEGEAPVMAGDG